MDILLLLIPLSIVLVFLGAWAFRWSLDHDQFDDLERHGRAILDEDTATDSVEKPLAAKRTDAQSDEY